MGTRVTDERTAVDSSEAAALDEARLGALLRGSGGPVGSRPVGGRVHLLGVGGAGVSGIGRILVARGVRVSGHDRAESQMLDALREVDLRFELCASEGSLLPPDVDLVIRSAAVSKDDPQVLAAEARGIPVLKYGEILPRLAPPERLLAVAGTHGKTTVSWMLWHALEGISELVETIREDMDLDSGLSHFMELRIGGDRSLYSDVGSFWRHEGSSDAIFLQNRGGSELRGVRYGPVSSPRPDIATEIFIDSRQAPEIFVVFTMPGGGQYMYKGVPIQRTFR